jgi:hypothetical protein
LVAQRWALKTLLKESGRHRSQFRSVVPEPGLSTYCPAWQIVLVTQGVAALASSSQVSPPQASAAAAPPAQ